MLFNDEVDHSDSKTRLSDPQLLDDFDYHPTEMHLMDFEPDRLTEKEIEDPVDSVEFLQTGSVTWLNVMGLEDIDALEVIREKFAFHPLVLEDILRPFQRPKFEVYDDYIFLINKLFNPGNAEDVEQISFVLGQQYLITFQESSGDVFDNVRRRIRNGNSRIRKSGPDYLMYELVDAVVDAYFPALESIGDQLETLEKEITQDQRDQDSLEDIHEHRRHLLILRRTAWSQREMLGQLQKGGLELVTDETQIYVRDSYDHAIRILDVIESYREMASSLHELSLSMASMKMNSTMKVLTIIATIFIPLTFVAGIYGMNFDPEVSPWNMPELGWYYGYPFSLGIMLLITIVMVLFFRRKGWI